MLTDGKKMNTNNDSLFVSQTIPTMLHSSAAFSVNIPTKLLLSDKVERALLQLLGHMKKALSEFYNYTVNVLLKTIKHLFNFRYFSRDHTSDLHFFYV